MLQTSGLPATARVGELVEFARGLYPYPLSNASIIGRAGLSGLERRTVEHLSGGEAQRVRFALAIAGDPDLLFLDEPTVGMDVETRRAFWSDMRAFAADGRTILFATHYLDEADAIAERILVLVRGRIVADGTGSSIKAMVTDRTVRFTLQGNAAGGACHHRGDAGGRSVEVVGERVSVATADPDSVVHALVASGLPMRDLEIAGASLEDAFVALTTPDSAASTASTAGTVPSRQGASR